jgi:ABC-type glycerol-3-phosphate transport system permease component
MKQASAGTLSSCLVWVIAFFALSACILPISMMVGGFTSFSDFAIQQTGEFICPENTTPSVYSYASTTTDEYGNRQPSTAYVLQCKDANGEVVKEDPVGYAFLWMGIIAGIGLVLSAVLAFLLAAPAGVLIARFLHRIKKPA